MLPSNLGDVVPKGDNRALRAVDSLDQNILMRDVARQFQLGIVDRPRGIRVGYQLILNDRWKLSPPHKWGQVAMSRGGKPRTTHASTRGIVGPNGHRMIRYELRNSRWALAKILGQEFEIGQLVPHLRGNTDPIHFSVLQGSLQRAEEALGAGDPNRHTAQLPQDLVPRRQRNPATPPNFVEDSSQPLLTMGRQLKGALGGIDDPTQDTFHCLH